MSTILCIGIKRECECMIVDTSMHVERAEIIEHSPFVPPITHPTINYQHHLNSGVDS